MTNINRKINILIIFLFFNTAHSKKRYFKFFKADIKGYEPYTNVTYFKLKPINRNLAVVNADIVLNRDFENGLVSMYFSKSAYF